jgi:hypothetical protein
LGRANVYAMAQAESEALQLARAEELRKQAEVKATEERLEQARQDERKDLLRQTQEAAAATYPDQMSELRHSGYGLRLRSLHPEIDWNSILTRGPEPMPELMPEPEPEPTPEPEPEPTLQPLAPEFEVDPEPEPRFGWLCCARFGWS